MMSSHHGEFWTNLARKGAGGPTDPVFQQPVKLPGQQPWPRFGFVFLQDIVVATVDFPQDDWVAP